METTHNRFKKILRKYKISYKEITENESVIIGIENKENFSIDCLFNKDGTLKEIVKNKWVHEKASTIDFIGIKNNNYELRFFNEKDLLGQLNLNLKTKEVEFA